MPPYDDDSRGNGVTYIQTPDSPLKIVPVDADLAEAIRRLCGTYPNLGRGSVLSEIRRQFPDVTMDQVRTVMAGHADGIR